MVKCFEIMLTKTSTQIFKLSLNNVMLTLPLARVKLGTGKPFFKEPLLFSKIIITSDSLQQFGQMIYNFLQKNMLYSFKLIKNFLPSSKKIHGGVNLEFEFSLVKLFTFNGVCKNHKSKFQFSLYTKCSLTYAQ
jgi:hypothetical protein